MYILSTYIISSPRGSILSKIIGHALGMYPAYICRCNIVHTADSNIRCIPVNTQLVK